MVAFTYTALPARVVFAEGSLVRLGEEVARLGCGRPFVIASQRYVVEVAAVGRFTDAAMHTPVEVTERALAQLANADCLIAVGGGSAIGLAKALALRTDLPQIAVPTTYAGSEATPVLGQTADGKKTTLRDLKLLPEVIVYDVALTRSLPRALTMTSGLNAMAHAVEAVYSPDANPVTTSFAEQALAALSRALPRLAANLDDMDARSDALLGAWTAGTCLGSVGMGLHHKLCHVLGGSFGLPHSETHAVMLPYVTAFNAIATERVARAIGSDDAASGLRALAEAIAAPLSLRQLGMPEDGLDRAAELATAAPYPNPRPIERTAIRALLGAAWQGAWP